MPLNFITGAPGSGKTTVTTEVAARGITIYDTDDQNRTGMAGWHDLVTGQYVAGFNELKLTEDILKTHLWSLTDRALADFRLRAETELIYLCGRLREPEPVIAASRYLIIFNFTWFCYQRTTRKTSADTR